MNRRYIVGPNRGRTVGRVFDCIRKYNYSFGDNLFMGSDQSLASDPHMKNIVCTYEWLSDTDIPIFKFTEAYSKYEKLHYHAMKRIFDDAYTDHIYLHKPFWSEKEFLNEENQIKEDRHQKIKNSIMEE